MSTGELPRRSRLIVAAALVMAAMSIAVPAHAGVVPPSDDGALVSTNPADLTPHAQNGEARAFAQIGNTVYVGGSFTAVKEAGSNSWIARRYLIAYNRTTGALSPTFLPQVDSSVNGLAVSPDGKLIVGGQFQTVNGVARRNLVEVDPVTGQTVPGWSGRSDGGVVRAMAIHGNDLYIGGGFRWINGTAHSLLARLDASTGAVDPTFQIDARVPRAGTELVWTMAVSPDGRTLVAAGNFSQVNGLPRNQIVMVDTAGTASVTAWRTQRYAPPCVSASLPFYVQDVDFSDDGSYFVVGANGATQDGAYCDSVARFETAGRGDNLDATWVQYTGKDSVTAVEATDGVVYAAGHFRWLNNANGADSPGPGYVDRLGIGSLDATNGMPLNWNPRRSGGGNLPAGAAAWGSNVAVLWRGNDGLYFGHNSDGMGNEYHGRMGMFPLAGGRMVAVQNAPHTTPGYLYLGAGDGTLTKVPYTGSSIGSPAPTAQPNLAGSGAAFMVSNKLYWAKRGAPGSDLQFSFFNGTVQPSWTNSYNQWFRAADLSGAFVLDGRMYYTRAGADRLFYRYLEPDSYLVGCTEFTLPTVNVPWGQVRGMTWVAGKLVYGATDGALRAVAFDPTAASGSAVDGATTSTVAAPTAGLTWTNPTLFYAPV
jgi:hypothetical protein